jgi:Holliday junction resolvasome RuvABC endonuclease subunit
MTPPNGCRILGVDPGSRDLGVAVLDWQRDPEQFAWPLVRSFRVPDGDFALKLYEVDRIIERLLVAWRPRVMVVEGIFLHPGTRNALAAGQLAKVVGVIERLAVRHVQRCYETRPSSARKTLGCGNAGYDVIRARLAEAYGASGLVVAAIESEDALSACVQAHAGYYVMERRRPLQGVNVVFDAQARPHAPPPGLKKILSPKRALAKRDRAGDRPPGRAPERRSTPP